MSVMESVENKNICFKTLTDDARNDFLERHYGEVLGLHYENACFHLADLLIKDYSGGFWHFAESPEGLPFMYFTTEDIEINNVFLDNPITLPGVLAGLSVSAQAIILMIQKEGLLINDSKHDELVDRYHDLIGFGYSLAKHYQVEELFFKHVD